MRSFAAFLLIFAASACASGSPAVDSFCTLTGGPPPLRLQTVDFLSQDEVDWMLALVKNGRERCGW